MNIIEYAIEAICLGAFMVVATIVTTIFQLPNSPVHQAIADPLLRRFLIGVIMALTSMSIVYSPLGMRSGAHLNPSVTLTFWRLKKIRSIDACFYILAQALGAILGIWFAGILIGMAIADPAVNYIATVPSSAGEFGAFWVEFLLSLGMMTLILQISNHPKLSRLTGVFCGMLLVVYIAIAAPISGVSMNPARSLGSAIPAQAWHGFWIYCVAPPIGMLLAAELYLRTGKKKTRSQLCCKLCPNSSTPCLSPICCQM
jgi:aquaporin Z